MKTTVTALPQTSSSGFTQTFLMWIFAMLVSVQFVSAQTARVQVIHNAADPSAQTVDIYIDSALAIDDFEFRAATPYIDLPAGQEIVIGVAGGTSSSASEAIATFPVTLDANETYVVIANGVLNPSSFASNPDGRATGFNLWIKAMAKEAVHSNSFEFVAVHGASDAPAVDIIARNVATLVPNASYGDITDYIEVPTGKYKLDVNAAGTSTTVASYALDASGFAGKTAVVLASGFLTPSTNQSGDAFGLIAVFADGSVAQLAAPGPPTARVQIIHNSADPGAAEVDIYLNEALTLDNFAFRSATPYIDLLAEEEIVIGVAGSTSSSASEALATFPVTLAEDEAYVVVANGVLDPSSFASNPNGRSTGFTLFVLDGKETAGGAHATLVRPFHGVTDAPLVNVAVRNDVTLMNARAYGDPTAYIGVPSAPIVVDVFATGSETPLASFDADLTGALSSTAVVLASGFLDPSVNSNGEGFGLLAVFPDGTAAMLPAAAEAQSARVQIIHNAADPGAAVVDIYLGETLAVDDFEFRNATPFLDLPAGEEIVIGVAPGTSASSADAIATFPVTLTPNGTFTVVANGVLSPGDFASNPEERSTAFTLWVTESQEESTVAADVQFYVVHGASDAPAVDVVAQGVGALVENAAYGDITDYLSVAPASYTLDINVAGTSTTAATFVADLSAAEGAAIGVLASGFLDPSANQDGAGFGLLAVFPNGDTALLPAPEADPTARVQIIHNAADPGAAVVDIYLGETLAVDDFEFRNATPFLDLPAGVELSIGVAPGTSSSSAEALATFPVTLTEGETYSVVANGVLDPSSFATNPDERPTGFNLWVTNSNESFSDTSNTYFYIIHGATDAPGVDVIARDVAPLAENAKYGDITDLITVPAASYMLDINVAGTETTVASYLADLTGAGGVSIGVLASGFLDPTTNNDGEAFGLLAVFPDGTTALLPTEADAMSARVQIIHNAADPGASTVDIYLGETLAVDDFDFRSATPFLDIPAGEEVVIGVAPGTSSSASEALATFPVTLDGMKT